MEVVGIGSGLTKKLMVMNTGISGRRSVIAKLVADLLSLVLRQSRIERQLLQIARLAFDTNHDTQT